MKTIVSLAIAAALSVAPAYAACTYPKAPAAIPDGGAAIFAESIRELRRLAPGTGIEVLIPDFDGEDAPLRAVMEAAPDILDHNVETVERLQKPVRKRARYDRSLQVLARAKEMASELGNPVHTKSSVMVGLGEEREELLATFRDLRSVDCDILTIGQYLRPTTNHLPVARWVEPETFEMYKRIGEELGIGHVESSPLTRSSYHARESAEHAVPVTIGTR